MDILMIREHSEITGNVSKTFIECIFVSWENTDHKIRLIA